MVLIFGWGGGPVEDRGDVAPIRCPNCHNDVYFHHIHSTRQVSLFFVPVMPYRTDEYLACPVCRQAMQIPPSHLSAVLAMHATTAAFRAGTVTEPEYRARIDAFWQSMGIARIRGNAGRGARRGRRRGRPAILRGSAAGGPAGQPGSPPRRRYPDRRRVRRGEAPAIGAMNVARKHGKKESKADPSHEDVGAPSSTAGSASSTPMTNKDYEREMRRLHGELVAMQEWVKSTGAKVCIVFEGRDTAGKGGTIKRITERVSPRVFKVVALSAPTERERSQMYIQRYLPHFPAGGEVVIFDRSWYNRAGVERVMGFCTPAETDRFLEQVPAVEKAMVDSGIILLKYWLEVSPEEQTRRLEGRIHDPRKVWKLTDMDLKSYGRWDDYSRARDAMFAATDTPWAPWYLAHTDDKKRGRLNIISHLLSQVPYDQLELRDIALPKRSGVGRYVGPDLALRFIPAPF